MTLKQIFKLLNNTKNHKQLLDLVFSSFEKNSIINNKKEIYESIQLAYLILFKRESYRKNYGHYYRQQLINEYENGESRRLTDNKGYFKDKSFIDSIVFSVHFSDIISYNNLLDWDFDYLITKLRNRDLEILAGNKYFKWSSSLLEKHKDRLNVDIWEKISKRQDLDWSKDLLERYADNWKWDEIAKNISIPFSEELVIYFKEQWKKQHNGWIENLWFLLLNNDSVQWTCKLFKFYLLEKENNFKNWNGGDYRCLCNNKGVFWSTEYIDVLTRYRNYYSPKNDYNRGDSIAPFLTINIPWTISVLDSNKEKFDWTRLSSRADIPWDEVMRKLTEFIDWKQLSKNESVNWSYNKIEEFESHIDFRTLSLNPKVEWNRQIMHRYKTRLDWSALALNEGIKWNNSLIDEFQNQDYFYSLTKSNNLIWSTDILMKFKDRWDDECSYFIGRRCNDCMDEHEFYSPEICKNNDVIFTVEYISENIKEWERLWIEFTTKSNYENSLVELNGEFIDSKNQIWKDISNNKNLSMSLIVYFKDFWDYKTLLDNNNIIWSFKLILALEDHLNLEKAILNSKRDQALYNGDFITKWQVGNSENMSSLLRKFWSDISIYNIFSKTIMEDNFLDELIDFKYESFKELL